MTNVKRGRKPLKKGENLVPVRVFVKEKHFDKVPEIVTKIANNYR